MQRNRNRRQNLIAMQTWWLERMIAIARAAAREDDAVLARALHQLAGEGHRPRKSCSMQNQLFRQYALGNVRDLTLHVSQDPAMLRYLDNNVNVQGASERKLRARADGAVHARHRQLHRAGHARVGARVHRLDVPPQPGRQRHVRRQPPRSTTTARRRSSARAATSAAPTSSTSSSASRPRRAGSPASCWRSSSTSIPSRSCRPSRRADPQERLRAAAGDVDAAAQQRVLQRARVPRAGEEPGRVRRRHAPAVRHPRGRAGRARRAARDGPGAVLSAQRQGLGRRRGVAQQPDDAHARELRQRASRRTRR